MISETEKHISPLFFPSFDEGLPSAGPHVCPAAPSQTLQDQAKAHSHHISLFPGEVTAALFWEQVGGGKDLFIYFFALPFYSFASFNYRRTEFELFLSSSFLPGQHF